MTPQHRAALVLIAAMLVLGARQHAQLGYQLHFRDPAAPEARDDWVRALDRMPEPVFVSFGNAAYRDLLANFLCATARFEGMHAHTLLLVLDNASAAHLRRIAPNATVLVLPETDTPSLHAAHSYGEEGYLWLMRLRGRALLALLEHSWRHGNRTLVWLEADAHYNRNLLARSEIVQPSGADVVLARDHGAYAGGFIRFAPSRAAASFYAAVVQRMARAPGLNDQALLNSVVRSQRHGARLRTLDPCRYRSGAALLPSFRRAYARRCGARHAIVQQHNWRVGADAKVAVARAEGAWFLADNNKTCI